MLVDPFLLLYLFHFLPTKQKIQKEIHFIMMKMLIKLDEEKIIREGQYDIKKINDYLLKAFQKRHMNKDPDHWYTNGNFVSCGSLILTLSRKEWFLPNVQSWLWYDSDDDSTEDLKEYYRKEALRG